MRNIVLPFPRRILFPTLCSLVALAALARPAIATAESSDDARDARPAARSFLVFESLAYIGKPDMMPLGVLPARGTGELWRPGRPRSVVDRIGVQRAMACCVDFKGVFYLDVEHWPVYNQPDEVSDRNIGKYIELADAVHAAAPQLKIGFYGVLPEIVYWPIVSPAGAAELNAWHLSNRRMRQLAAHVDVIFPSLYTFYDDPAGWEAYARETLKEAKTHGKPVYAFLWPEFHDSNEKLRGRNLPRDFWRRELEFCRLNADGIVIWGGWQRRWDENADWWQETRLFLRSLREGAAP